MLLTACVGFFLPSNQLNQDVYKTFAFIDFLLFKAVFSCLFFFSRYKVKNILDFFLFYSNDDTNLSLSEWHEHMNRINLNHGFIEILPI